MRRRRIKDQDNQPEAHLSSEVLSSIFEIRQGSADICKRRESATLEFKENFHASEAFLAKLGKSMAAFSNNRGGYIVFGITPAPHRLKGMTNDKFDRTDPSRITQFLASHFQPTVQWDSLIHERDGKRFGIIYVYPSHSRPTVATSCFTDCFREGEVLFRYSGESRSIKAADLLNIIAERIQDEQRSWQRTLQRMATITPDQALILDGLSGQLSTGQNILMVDPELLAKIKWIKEGQFKSTSGEPTLRLVGDVRAASGGPIVATRVAPQAITVEAIVLAFLSGICPNPRAFLEALPYASSIYLPIWFFVSLSGLTAQEAANHIRQRRYAGKVHLSKLIRRLESDCLENRAMGSILSLEVPNFKTASTFSTQFEQWSQQPEIEAAHKTFGGRT